jgi:hypothetical protein
MSLDPSQWLNTTHLMSVKRINQSRTQLAIRTVELIQATTKNMKKKQQKNQTQYIVPVFL